jgi:GNAT superfamily N-acetyltransferase
MTVEVVKVSVDQFIRSPNGFDLLDEYALTRAIDGLPTPTPDIEFYRVMEERGMLHVLAAINEEDEIVGFACVTTAPNPHHNGAIIGVMESIFVSEVERSTGAGLSLIREAKRFARELGAVGFFSSALVGSELDEVYKRMDCVHTNNNYFWALD